MQPGVLVGIGPGGALIAAMIAKQLIDEEDYEPFVTTIDRVFERKGAYLDVQVGEIRNLTTEMDALSKPILVVASEVHTGNTVQKVSAKLGAAGIDHRTFAFLASPSSCYKLDYCVLSTNERSILPWRDSPTRSY
jgi:pyrimidine operon attenuation protein/uracil phosphoribosyltransferase